MPEYSASVSSRMTIDGHGNRLNEMDVRVSGYRDSKALDDAVSAYNRGEDVGGRRQEFYERWADIHEQLKPGGKSELPRNWRRRLWWVLYASMLVNLRRWRRRRL